MSRLIVSLLFVIACSGNAEDTSGTDKDAHGDGGGEDGGGEDGGGDDGSGDAPTELSAGGATVLIPAGAAPEGVEPMAAVEDPGVPAEGYEITGDVYAFTPHGTPFSAPVTISLPISSDATDPVVIKLDDASDTTWEAVSGVTVADGIATFEVTSFSYYATATSAGSGADADGDGYDDIFAGGTDCDDSDPSTYPGASEVCDGTDNDCDGLVDEDAGSEFCVDGDGDGFGAPGTEVRACSAPAGYVSDCTDCNDGDGAVGGGC